MDIKLTQLEEYANLIYSEDYLNFSNYDLCFGSKCFIQLYDDTIISTSEVIFYLYESMYKLLLNKYYKISKLNISPLEKLNLFVNTFCEFVVDNKYSFIVTTELKSRFENVISKKDSKEINFLVNEFYLKQISLIDECKSKNYLKDINSDIIVKLIDFLTKSQLGILFDEYPNSPPLKELEIFFWDTILKDSI